MPDMSTTSSAFDLQRAQEYITTIGLQAAMNVGMAALILIIGFMIAGAVGRTIRKIPDRNPKLDRTLANFFASIAKYLILAVVIIAVLTRFGVQTTSLVAVLGAASLAIGLALQGTLSNVAAGVMIIFFRPYKIGDFVEVAGVSGSVKDISLFYTELNTPDNKQIIIPNGQSWGDVITNYSAYPTRRCDFVFSAGYDDDIEKVISVLRSTFEGDERVMKEPELFVEVKSHGASSVDYVVRAWCQASDYWGLHFDMNKKVKQAFDTNGIEIPYPHQVEIQKQG